MTYTAKGPIIRRGDRVVFADEKFAVVTELISHEQYPSVRVVFDNGYTRTVGTEEPMTLMRRGKVQETNCLNCGRQTCDRQPEDKDPKNCKDWRPRQDTKTEKQQIDELKQKLEITIKEHTCCKVWANKARKERDAARKALKEAIQVLIGRIHRPVNRTLDRWRIDRWRAACEDN